jgi:transposase-like protein
VWSGASYLRQSYLDGITEHNQDCQDGSTDQKLIDNCHVVLFCPWIDSGFRLVLLTTLVNISSDISGLPNLGRGTPHRARAACPPPHRQAAAPALRQPFRRIRAPFREHAQPKFRARFRVDWLEQSPAVIVAREPARGGSARRGIYCTGRRRRWPAEQKALIVAETYEAGKTVSAVACRHGLTPQLLFTLRREAQRARSGASRMAFAPVVLETSRPRAGAAPIARSSKPAIFRIAQGRMVFALSSHVAYGTPFGVTVQPTAREASP